MEKSKDCNRFETYEQDDIEGRNLHRASIFRSILACAIPGDREREFSTLKNANCVLDEVRSSFVLPREYLSVFWHGSSLSDSVAGSKRIIMPLSMICQPDRRRVRNVFFSIFPLKYPAFTFEYQETAIERLWFIYRLEHIFFVLWLLCWN